MSAASMSWETTTAYVRLAISQKPTKKRTHAKKC